MQARVSSSLAAVDPESINPWLSLGCRCRHSRGERYIGGLCRSYTVPVTVAVTFSRRASLRRQSTQNSDELDTDADDDVNDFARHHGIASLPRLDGRPQGLDYRHRDLLRKPRHDPHRVPRYVRPAHSVLMRDPVRES